MHISPRPHPQGTFNHPRLLSRFAGLVIAGIMAAVLFSLVRVHTAAADSSDVANLLRALAFHVGEGEEASANGDTARIQAEYAEIKAFWETIEDDVKATDAGAYVRMESALNGLKEAVQATPVDVAAVGAAYTHLNEEIEAIAAQLDSTATGGAPVATEATPATLLARLDDLYEVVETGDVPTAQAHMDNVVLTWLAVEGAIAANSPDAYNEMETLLGQASGALTAQSVDLGAAEVAIAAMREQIAPFVSRQTYTAFDAAAIILREGLEALLVIVALVAFLDRSGNRDKRRWIWLGAAAGICASLITAIALQFIFNRAAAGQNREVIEGVTALIAAVLLFYVSYWLHSKANLNAWQSYINDRTGHALRQGSTFGLSLLAFLAIFREGAETVVFYLGMAPSISSGNLLLGLALGVAILTVAAVLMMVVGVKLPLRPFFRVAGLLVYYLGFKFVGAGIHALQLAGILPTSLVKPIPPIPFFGIYPTWETLAPQLLLLLAAIAAFLYLRQRDQRMQRSTVNF